jgi:hypothetical protein
MVSCRLQPRLLFVVAWVLLLFFSSRNVTFITMLCVVDAAYRTTASVLMVPRPLLLQLVPILGSSLMLRVLSLETLTVTSPWSLRERAMRAFWISTGTCFGLKWYPVAAE